MGLSCLAVLMYDTFLWSDQAIMVSSVSTGWALWVIEVIVLPSRAKMQMRGSVELAWRHTLRADRTLEGSGKTRGGGLCIYINKAWCTNSAIVGSHCSANLEFLMVKCRPFYLPREFTSTIITAAYIHPDADAKLAMKRTRLLDQTTSQVVFSENVQICCLQNIYRYFQSVSCPISHTNML